MVMYVGAAYGLRRACGVGHEYRGVGGGAHSEQTMALGLMPVQTWSAHWLAHPQFARAIDDFLEREGAGVETYLSELDDRRPFKAGPTA